MAYTNSQAIVLPDRLFNLCVVGRWFRYQPGSYRSVIRVTAWIGNYDYLLFTGTVRRTIGVIGQITGLAWRLASQPGAGDIRSCCFLSAKKAGVRRAQLFK